MSSNGKPRIPTVTATLVALIGATVAFGAMAVSSQAPAPVANLVTGMAPPSTGTANSSVPTDQAQALLRDALDRRLQQAKARLKEIENSPGRAADAPPKTPEDEITERNVAQKNLVGTLQQQRNLLDSIDAITAGQAETERDAKAWRGFTTPPPYSVLMVDALRDAERNAEARLAAAESRRAYREKQQTLAAADIKAAHTNARLAAEAADRAQGTPEYPALDWKRNLTAVQSELAEAADRNFDLMQREAREDAEAAIASRDLARRKLNAIGTDIDFLPGDLDRVRAELDTRIRRAETDPRGAPEHVKAAELAQARADDELAAARSERPANAAEAAALAARIEALARTAALRREQLDTARRRATLLQEEKSLLDMESYGWRIRSTALKWHDPVRTRAEYESVTQGITAFEIARDGANQEIMALKNRIAGETAKLPLATAAEAADLRALIDTLRERQRDLEDILLRVEPLQRLMANFRADFQGRRDISAGERATDAAAAAMLVARRVWNYELVTVEDSVLTAEGRTLQVQRSITVGKSFGAVLIVVLGYLVCSAIVRRIETLLVRRGRFAAQSAAQLRNWTLFMLMAMLVVVALLSSSIPLTAFAFLGGALAIAAGFGLQTLLKNFVAGVMLLFERPMRLDDLVEVDGFRGRVTSIGIRASTITSSDGVETMIPNSAFVENKLTNWTHTNPLARQTIAIGVAYGSPLRRVGDILVAVLKKHGQVLKSPEPEVFVEDFAANAITFRLTYWLDFSPGSRGSRVRSDILQMIDSAFADAGISLPFPQQDVHLDAKGPLRVEIVEPPPVERGPN